MRLEDRVRLPDRYRPTRFIAGGGMAGVWEAEDTLLGRRVAVKVLDDRLAEDPVNTQRFAREARAAARVSSHPRVVTIYDVGEHEGRSFIVMERLTGGTVADALRRGRVPRRRALRWLRDAAEALDAAHEHGIVHRDVKPGNLLRDDQEHVRVADFGIARLATEDTVTTAGQLIGTAAYLSPEQVVGRPTTPASDRYALAVVAYELLTGRRPFQAAHPTAQARQHLEDDPEPPSAVDPSLPPAVDAVIARGMAKEPEDRWPSAGAFVSALERALAAGGGETTTRRMAAPVIARRRPPWLALAALLVVAAAAGAIVALSSGGGGHPLAARSTAGPARHHTSSASRKASRPKAATTTPATAQPTAQNGDVGALNARQIQAYRMIAGGQAAAGLALDRSILATLAQRGYGVQRCREPASDPACMVYAHALYDVGHALRVLGQPAAAIPYLRQRLQIDDQRAVVQRELEAALQEAGAGGAPPKAKGHAKGHGPKGGD